MHNAELNKSVSDGCITVEPSDTGYTVEVSTVELGGDSSEELQLTAHVAGEYTYHSGDGAVAASVNTKFEQYKSVSFTVANKPVEKGSKQLSNLTTFLGGNFEPISIAGTYKNLDNDPIAFELEITGGEHANDVSYSFNNETEELVFDGMGKLPANYHATLKAKDLASSAWTDLCGFDITVFNQPPVKNPDADPADAEVTVWSDIIPGLQSRSKCPKAVTVDLSQYWIDPDGLPLNFEILQAGTSDNDKDPPPFTVTKEGGSQDGRVTISATKWLKTTSSGFIVYEVKDSAEEGSETGAMPLRIRVRSGILENLIWAILILAVIVAFVFVILFLVNRHYIRGKWDITVELISGEDVLKLSTRAPQLLKKGTGTRRTAKFKLCDYLRRNMNNLRVERGEFKKEELRTQARRIMDKHLKAVTLRAFGLVNFVENGCFFEGCTANSEKRKEGEPVVTVKCAGADVRENKFKYTGGDMKFIADEGDGSRLTVTMSVK